MSCLPSGRNERDPLTQATRLIYFSQIITQIPCIAAMHLLTHNIWVLFAFIGENQQLVTNEPVSLRNYKLKLKTAGNYRPLGHSGRYCVHTWSINLSNLLSQVSFDMENETWCTRWKPKLCICIRVCVMQWTWRCNSELLENKKRILLTIIALRCVLWISNVW